MEHAMIEAQAGSLESGDLLVLLRSGSPGQGLSINLQSPVKAQFGAHVTRVVETVLLEHGINDAEVLVNDRGALDYAIRARVAACAERFCALWPGAGPVRSAPHGPSYPASQGPARSGPESEVTRP